MKIRDKLVGKESPCFIIAEAGANFCISDDPKKNFEHALKLIDIAAEAKADAVKFQLYRSDKLYVKDAGTADYIGKKKSIYDIIKEMELPYKWLPGLKEYCDKKNIIFLCTPFDEESADQLEKLGIEAYKIASYAISHISLLKYIARKGKPMILSTGASDYEDIQKAIGAIKEEGNSEIAIMQCTAKYPAPMKTMNLKTIPEMMKIFGVPVGLSDHSREPYVAPVAAVTLGAKLIEKHFTTDNDLPGPDHGFAVLADELKNMVIRIRMAEQALGTAEKKVLTEEKELFDFCRRGVFATKAIKKGESFTRENVAALRPGNKKIFVAAEKIDLVLKSKAKRDILTNEALMEDDF